MRVIKEPELQFKCRSCGAVNEGSEKEFTPMYTRPPTFKATCGFCNLENEVYMPALAAKVVGQLSTSDVLSLLRKN